MEILAGPPRRLSLSVSYKNCLSGQLCFLFVFVRCPEVQLAQDRTLDEVLYGLVVERHGNT